MRQGQRVAGRYHLHSELAHDEAREVWAAIDERLERRVAVIVFSPSIEPELLRERTGRAATLTHPNVTRVFDSGTDSGRVFCVRELVPAALSWTDLPLETDDAVRIATDVTEALTYAHERGIAHGGLGPGTILLSESGAKVADFGLTAKALIDEAPTPDQDTADLARLLRDLGSPELRPIADHAASGTATVAEGLRRLRPAPPAPSRRPIGLLLAAGAALIGLIVFGAMQLGPQLGGPEGSTPQPAISGTPFDVATVADFDPLGDGREGRSSVASISDGDPRTFWSTERYRGDPAFAGLKSGVGVILELGEAELAGRAQILFPTSGCSIELRVSGVRARDVNDWEVLGEIPDAPQRGVLSFPPTSSRWWLVWVTRLTTDVPGARDGFACAISEAQLYPPA